MALSGALLLPSTAFAVAGFKEVNAPNPALQEDYNGYKFEIYEWRSDVATQRSLPTGCNMSTAPIVVMFHGADGTDNEVKVLDQTTGLYKIIKYKDSVLYGTMPDLARRLANACVRFVAVQGRTSISTNAALTQKAYENTAILAERMTVALGRVANKYPSTTNIALFSGSFGGVTAAALMRTYIYSYTNDSNGAWSKLDRFILNVPAGDTCHTRPAADFSRAYTTSADGYKCNRDVGLLWDGTLGIYRPDAYGYIAQTFSTAELQALYDKTEVHLLVGSQDGVPIDQPDGNWLPIPSLGDYTPAEFGLRNYLKVSGLERRTSPGTYDPTSGAPGLSPRSYRITSTIVKGAGHSNLWNYSSNVSIGMCQLMARSFVDANGSTRDLRNLTDAGLITGCKK